MYIALGICTAMRCVVKQLLKTAWYLTQRERWTLIWDGKSRLRNRLNVERPVYRLRSHRNNQQ